MPVRNSAFCFGLAHRRRQRARRPRRRRRMIGYVTVGSNDLERGAAFYDELLAELGAKRVLACTSSKYFGRERLSNRRRFSIPSYPARLGPDFDRHRPLWLAHPEHG
jgi:hypothetical protein